MKNKIWRVYFLGLMLTSQTLFANKQHNQDIFFAFIDSMQFEIKMAKHDTIVLETYNQIYNTYYNSFIKEVKPYNDTLIQKAIYFLKTKKYQEKEKNKINKLLSSGYNNFGVYFHISGELDSAIVYYLKSINIDEQFGQTKDLADMYSNLGVVFQYKGDVPKMLEFHTLSLKIREKIKDTAGIVSSLQSLGTIYFYQNDTSASLKYYRQALELAIKSKNEMGEASALYAIATTIINQSNSDTVLKMLKRTLGIRTKNNHFRGVAYSSNAIAGVYSRRNMLDSALHFYQNGLNYMNKIGDKTGIVLTNFHLGNIHLKKNQTKEALNIAAYVLEEATKLKIPGSIANGHLLFFNAFKLEKNWEKALYHYENYIVLIDSVTNDESKKMAIRQQTQYEFEKEQLIKQQQEQEQERIAQEEKERRDNIQYSLIFLTILLVFGSVLGLGFVKVSPKFAEGLIFFAFLIFFEFCLVLLDPYIDDWSSGEPIYKLLFNALLAGAIFPAHAFFESKLKTKLIRK
jgi:tetratricopeptide (TPR) repeat protein